MADDALAPYVARICRSFSYLMKCFKYLCQINVEEWHKMQIYVYVPSENLARRVKKGLKPYWLTLHSSELSRYVSILVAIHFK